MSGRTFEFPQAPRPGKPELTDAAASKLFGKNKQAAETDQPDAIQSADPQKKVRYVNIRIKGHPDDYKITLEKNKAGKKG